MFRVATLIFALCTSLQATEAQPEENLARPYILAIYGPRGSGRAILAMRLKERFSFPNFSMASLVTDHLIEDTPLGEKAREYEDMGNNFPEDFPLKILYDRLLQSDCSKGLLLEDFPRTEEQAQALFSKLSPKFHFLVFHIDNDYDWLVHRVENRLVCRICGKVYDNHEDTPQKKTCDICSSTLHQRPDDSPEVVRARLQTYQKNLRPILTFFKEKEALITIQGDRALNEIYKEISAIIETQTKLNGQKTKSLKKMLAE